MKKPRFTRPGAFYCLPVCREDQRLRWAQATEADHRDAYQAVAVRGMAEDQVAVHSGEQDLPVTEGRQHRRSGMAERLGQQQVAEHATGAQADHEQTMDQARSAPEERQQRAHDQAVNDADEEVAGGRAIDAAEFAGQQLIEAEAQRRSQGKEDRRGEQRTTGAHHDQHANEADQHRQPLGAADPLTQERHGQGGDQQWREEVDRGGFSQGDIAQAGGEQQAGADHAQGPQQLQAGTLGAHHGGKTTARHEHHQHQQGMDHIAGPDHHHDRIEGREVLGQCVVAGEEQDRQANQDDTLQGMIRAFEW